MSTNTAIEWTDATWNPVTGCTKVSPGCDNCYAERITERFHGKGSFEKIVLHPDRLDQPLRWKKPRMVFVNSMSDLFHPDVPEMFISDVFARMAIAAQHTFQILTKRPRRMSTLLRSGAFHDAVHRLLDVGHLNYSHIWPLPNVWLGTSVEDQKRANLRVPQLLQTSATIRFLSCEPLLGPIDLYLSAIAPLQKIIGNDGPDEGPIDWVIVGGESGPGARPMHSGWARSLRDQCVAAGVPFFFKQWGGKTPKAGGRELDGRIWNEWPRAQRRAS